MSADLLAAFGNSQEPVPGNKISAGSVSPGENDLKPKILNDKDGESIKVLSHQELHAKQTPEEPLWRKDAEGADVLFDATQDIPDEDDFGAFEDAQRESAHDEVPRVVSVAPSGNQGLDVDLLGLDEELAGLAQGTLVAVPATTKPSHTSIYSLSEHMGIAEMVDDYWVDFPQSSKDQNHNFLPPTKPQPPVFSTPSNKLAFGQTGRNHVSDAQEEDWGDFSEAPVAPKPSSAVENNGAPPSGNSDPLDEAWEPFETSQEPSMSLQNPSQSPPTKANLVHDQPTPSSQARETRPTNIPPPTLLLSLLPGIFIALRNSISALAFTPDPPNTTSLSDDLASDLSTLITVSHATASRLIAGRSLRWKRDTYLSQSTKIGPAATSGKSGGMKLTSLDRRSEGLKEEREVAEVVSAWKQNAYRFNTLIKKTTGQKSLAMLQASFRAQSLSGTMTASHSCALCGLKRDERVLPVDGDVQDVFGEWWIEFWGHKDCKEWWARHQEMLRQR